jgi:hypothetical protein
MKAFLPDTFVASHAGSRLRSTAPLLIVGALVFAMSAGRILPATAGIGIVCLALLSALAVTRTFAVVVGSMVAIALIPVYWGPYVPHTQIGVLPVLLVCLALFPRAMRELRTLRLTTVDWLMAIYIGLRILGSLVNSSRGAGSALDSILYAGLPYVVFRFLGLERSVRRAAAIGVVIGGVAASYFTIREYDGGGNPFFNHFRSGYQHAYWIRVDYRFRRARPEASFGHADALGLFLAFATVLAIALAWRERNAFRRVLLYASAMVCLVGIADTLERGPFVLLLIALPIILIVEARQGHSTRSLALVLGAAVILSMTSVGATALKLRDASITPGGLQNSAQDRFDTIRAMTDSRYFSLLGHDQGEDPSLSVQQAIGLSTGLGAIENAFMWTYVVYGALAFLAFAGIAFPIGRAAFSTRFDVLDRAWLAIVVSAFVIFLSVSFASQFGHFFWIALGLSAAAAQTRSETTASGAPSDVGALELAR